MQQQQSEKARLIIDNEKLQDPFKFVCVYSLYLK